MLKILTSSYSSGIKNVLDFLHIESLVYVIHNPAQNLSHEEHNGIDIVYFGGGADVTPLFYGELNIRSGCDISRDLLEIYLFKRYIKNPKIKYAGICRGSQFLNVMYGGTLWQDLPYEHLGHEYIHLVTQGDEYPLAPDVSPLYNYGVKDKTFKVTSTHHQAVKELGSGLQMLLYEPYTKIIEGFYSLDDKTRAVQSHPEFLDESYKYSVAVLNYLFRIGE